MTSRAIRVATPINPNFAQFEHAVYLAKLYLATLKKGKNG